MAKAKEEKTNVMRVLDQKKIPYTPHAYPHGDGAGPGAGLQDAGDPGGIRGILRL